MKDDHKGGKLTCGCVFQVSYGRSHSLHGSPPTVEDDDDERIANGGGIEESSLCRQPGPAVAIGSALGRERDILTRVLTVTGRITSGVTEMCD